SGDENGIALLGSFTAPLQVVLGLIGLAVLVDPHQAEVEVVAGIGKVVRIPTEKADRLLRGHNQAQVAEALKAIQGIRTALMIGDHLTLHVGSGLARLLRSGYRRVALGDLLSRCASGN